VAVNLFQTYCLEAAYPTVLLMGTIEYAIGRINSGLSLMHYDLHSTVYNASTKGSISFTVAAFFRNRPRWANFPPLKLHTYIMIAVRIIGITTTGPRLALVVDDVYLLPTLRYALDTPNSGTAGQTAPGR